MVISNESAKHIAIHCAGLSATPTGPCNKAILLQLVKNLGYVQLDPLQVVARAHDHILWSRNNQYQPSLLDRLMSEDRMIFEHFCHDACVLPMDTLAYWQDQFKRQSEKRTSAAWRKKLTKKRRQTVLDRFELEGPLRSNDFKSPKKNGSKKVWSKPEHKQILDYLWLSGELAVSQRPNFSKYYDLAERIYPTIQKNHLIDKPERTHWLCTHALNCLGFATSGEIMRFWDALDLDTTKHWCEKNTDLMMMEVESATGERDEFIANQSLRTTLDNPPTPTTRLRIINPFDPLVRDRKRLSRLFGFDYRIEIYTPPAKRQYGYYVYPLLEFDSFVGRLEVKHDRKANQIVVDNLWPEVGVKFGKGRMGKLNSELERLRRFCQATDVVWS